MRIDIDLDTNLWLAQSGARFGLSLAEFKRDTSSPLYVRFYRAGVVVELAAGATGKFAIKPEGAYDTAPLVLAESWIKTGTATATVYTFTPAFTSAALAALLGQGNGTTADDKAFVSCMAEIMWIADSQKSRTQTVPVRVYNDVIHEEDGTPLSLPTPAEWLLGSTAPVNAAAASATINPTGDDNSVLYTATDAGTAGNATTVAYATPAEVATTEVAVSGQAITVTPGTKARMVITGELDDGTNPVTFPELLYSGVNNTKPFYNGADYLQWEAETWYLVKSGGGVWASTADVATPDLVPSGAWHADTNPTGWKPTAPATGTPVVTAGISSAAQVIEAVDDSAAAAALVTASASGTVTGAVAAVTATALTGGSGPTATPPYLRVHGGFLYVQEAGVWKKSTLATL